MSLLEKIKVASHSACCATYSMLFAGYHNEQLYVVAAVSYAALALAELKK